MDHYYSVTANIWRNDYDDAVFVERFYVRADNAESALNMAFAVLTAVKAPSSWELMVINQTTGRMFERTSTNTETRAY